MVDIFYLRAAALIERDNHLLLSKMDGDDFWALPGGQIEHGEPSDQALKREIKEELGIYDSHCLHLQFILENFFTYNEKSYHEVGFYYKTSIPIDCYPIATDGFKAAEDNILFKWFKIDDLKDVFIKPFDFYSLYRASQKSFIHHIVSDPTFKKQIA